MFAPKPTIEEQIKALAVLRKFAQRNRNAISMVGVNAAIKAAEAIDILDNADLFVALDEEQLANEIADEALSKENPS